MEEIIIDLIFNFSNDRSIIKTRIHSIIQTLERDIESFSSYINVKNVFKIIVEAKPVWLDMQRVSPTFSSVFQHSAKNFNRIQISDLAFFEKKMMLVSLVVIFENFAKDVLLLGAFYDPDKAKKMIPDEQKDEKKIIDDCVLNNDISGFESIIKKRLSFKKQAQGLKNAYKIIYGVDFFPNNEVEDILLDLIMVRNIIIHQNAIPREKDFNNLKFKNVIKRNSLLENFKIMGSNLSEGTLPNVITFSLDLFNVDFEHAVLNGMSSMISHISNKVLSQF